MDGWQTKPDPFSSKGIQWPRCDVDGIFVLFFVFPVKSSHTLQCPVFIVFSTQNKPMVYKLNTVLYPVRLKVMARVINA